MGVRPAFALERSSDRRSALNGSTIARVRGETRRWAIPPALVADAQALNGLDAGGILDEHSAESALALWQMYRDGVLWAVTPREHRRRLFRYGVRREWYAAIERAGLPIRVRIGLRLVAETLVKNDPRVAGSAARAALVVARFYEKEQATSTALAYALLAAFLSPAGPRPALVVSEIAQRGGRDALAETWFRRVIGLARRERDWDPFGRALIGLGRASERRSALASASDYYRHAIRLGKRKGLTAVRAEATHALLRLALQSGETERIRAVAGAVTWAASHHGDPDATARAHLDLAEAQTALGKDRMALRTLQKALSIPLLSGEDRVRAATLLVVAHAGLGNQTLLEDALLTAVGVIESLGLTEEGAARMLDLARATASALEDRYADRCAHRAREIALRVNAPQLVEDCDAFLRRPRLGTVPKR